MHEFITNYTNKKETIIALISLIRENYTKRKSRKGKI